MMSTLDRIDSTTKQFSADVVGLINKWPTNNLSETDEMVRYVLSDQWKAGEYAKRTLLDESRLSDKLKLDKLCKNLYFDSIGYREQSIPKRHAATFEWIFHEPRKSDDGSPLWSDFAQWLREDSQDIYWITGKPGSGKSTLVKFIANDPRFEQLLHEWAGETEILVARFFSWIAGANKLQKSQEGLFRTILLEVIRQRAQLAVDIFPARWFLLQSFDGNIQLPPITFDELTAGFQNLLAATGENLKLALFIDGLDEFDDDLDRNHGQLVQLLHNASTAAGVKICSSSRPWNVFKDAYSKNPMLRLENLTRDDIRSFVRGKLDSSPGYHDFAATNPKAVLKITTDIVDKSQGVFLWVAVISNLLDGGFQEGTSLEDLQQLVDNLPTEIADLFRFIWGRTGQRFRAEASQFFQAMVAWKQTGDILFALTLWFSAKEVPADIETSEVTEEYVKGAIKSLERKLMSRTGGLMEISSYGDKTNLARATVNFMHRTASDWVSENWASITSATSPDFNAYLWLIKGEALRLVLTTDTRTLFGARGFWLMVLEFASRIPGDYPNAIAHLIALDHLNNQFVKNATARKTWADEISRHIRKAQNDVTEQGTIREQGALGHFRTSLGEGIGLSKAAGLEYCTDLLALAARYPIPAFIKHGFYKEDGSELLPPQRYPEMVNAVVFGEIWYAAIELRLELLDFLTGQRFNPWLHQLQLTRRVAQDATDLLLEAEGNASPGVIYLTRVIDILTSRLPKVHNALAGRKAEEVKTKPPRKRDALKRIFNLR
jgi:hypothetical protein